MARTIVAFALASLLLTAAGFSEEAATITYQRKLTPPPVFPLVEVSMEGREVLMMLDTGAPITTMDTSLQQHLKARLSPAEVTRLDLPPGDYSYHPAPSLQLGETAVKLDTVIISELAPFREGSGLDLRGVMGCDVIRQYVLDADYDQMTLTLGKVLPPAASRMPSLPVEMRYGRPYIKVTLGGEEISLMVDTGVTGPMMLTDAVFSTFVDKGLIKVVGAMKAMTVRGMAERQLGQFTSGTLLGLELKDLQVSSGGVSDLLGQGILTRLHWVLHLDARKFYCEPLKNQRPVMPDRAGAHGVYKDGCMVVLDVKPGMLFDQLGIRARDRIIGFGPLKQGSINIVTIRELNNRSRGETIILQVMREGENEPKVFQYPMPK